MIGDLLLGWISETGSGAVDNLAHRAAWLAHTEDLDISEKASRRWIQDLSALGHCEVDWTRKVWSVAPPTITRLPSVGGLAVLCGARRSRLVAALEANGVYFEQARRPGIADNIPPPSTVLIPYDRTSDLMRIGTLVGAYYVGCGATRLLSLLKPIAASFNRCAPPAYASRFERFGPGSPPTWTKDSARNTRLSDGLYREQANGRWRYLTLRENLWYAVDAPSGTFAELARRGIRVVSWTPDSDDRPLDGTLSLDRWVPIPTLHRRALVLCSGFVPRLHPDQHHLMYDNVPREVAVHVASILGQNLHFDHQPSDRDNP